MNSKKHQKKSTFILLGKSTLHRIGRTDVSDLASLLHAQNSTIHRYLTVNNTVSVGLYYIHALIIMNTLSNKALYKLYITTRNNKDQISSIEFSSLMDKTISVWGTQVYYIGKLLGASRSIYEMLNDKRSPKSYLVRPLCILSMMKNQQCRSLLATKLLSSYKNLNNKF